MKAFLKEVFQSLRSTLKWLLAARGLRSWSYSRNGKRISTPPTRRRRERRDGTVNLTMVNKH